jgi:hypothetical protein
MVIAGFSQNQRSLATLLKHKKGFDFGNDGPGGVRVLNVFDQ